MWSKLGSKGEFEEALEGNGESLMVVQISTSRCGPCNFMYPYVVELSEEFQEANFSKIVGDESPECAVGVLSILPFCPALPVPATPMMCPDEGIRDPGEALGVMLSDSALPL